MDAFETAVKKSKEISKRPSDEDLLRLYALYKQATSGDVSEERPGGFDFKAMAKHDAWAAIKGKDSEEAKSEYISLVDALHNA